MKTAITTFRGKHRFLSNMFPCVVVLDGVEYPSVEHAYQAAKTYDADERRFIRCLPSAVQAKRRGKELEVGNSWELRKMTVMRELLRQKFTIHYSLCELLRATGKSELIHVNAHGDTYWGVCRGVGENHLGNLLMIIRSTL